MTSQSQGGPLWQPALILYVIGACCAYALMYALSPRLSMVIRSPGWVFSYTVLLFVGVGLLPRQRPAGRRAFDASDWLFGRRWLVVLLIGGPASASFGWVSLRIGVPWFRELFWMYVYTVLLMGSCGLIAWFLRQQRAEHIGMMRRPSVIWSLRVEEDVLWIDNGQVERMFYLEDIVKGQWIFDEHEGTHPELVDTIQLFLSTGDTFQLPASTVGAVDLLRLLKSSERLEEVPLTLV